MVQYIEPMIIEPVLQPTVLPTVQMCSPGRWMRICKNAKIFSATHGDDGMVAEAQKSQVLPSSGGFYANRWKQISGEKYVVRWKIFSLHGKGFLQPIHVISCRNENHPFGILKIFPKSSILERNFLVQSCKEGKSSTRTLKGIFLG